MFSKKLTSGIFKKLIKDGVESKTIHKRFLILYFISNERGRNARLKHANHGYEKRENSNEEADRNSRC